AVGDLRGDVVAHQRAQVVEGAEVFVTGDGNHQLLGRRIKGERQDLVGGGDLRGDGVDDRLIDVHAFEADHLVAALRSQGDVEIRFLDIAEVDEDSPERAALA